jgi:hypothetical protein
MDFVKSAYEGLAQGPARASATVGLAAMALAIAIAAGFTWLEPANGWLWALFLSGMVLFVSAFLLTFRWAQQGQDTEEKGRTLTPKGVFLSGITNIVMILLIIVGLFKGFIDTMEKRTPSDRLESALGTYVEATVADKKEVIPQAAYAVFAACERVRTINDEAERALLAVECRMLLGTPPTLDRARASLEKAKRLSSSAIVPNGQTSPVPSPSPGAPSTP